MAAVSSSAEEEGAGRSEPSGGPGESPRRAAAPRSQSTPRTSSRSGPAGELRYLAHDRGDRAPTTLIPLRPRLRRGLVNEGALFALRGEGIYSRLTLGHRVHVCRIDSI